MRSYARVERATGKTALLPASASVGVLREAQYPRCAFTMAEILLSLTIIGVVAAITLPSLTGNINERTWNTQRRALYARMSQAIALMPALNGYGTFDAGNESTSAVDTAAETFVTEGLSKVLKINNICDADHLADCGIPSTITNIAGTSQISPFPTKISEWNPAFTESVIYNSTTTYQNPLKDIDTKAAAFETQNGESIAVFYNPYCASDSSEMFYYAQPLMCANFIYDLNGNKGPNTVGKDIGFMTALYPSDSVVVAPVPLARKAGDTNHINALVMCKNQDSESRLPNRDELSSMFYNQSLMGISGGYFWSSSVITPGADGRAWAQFFDTGHRNAHPRRNAPVVWCVKR